VPLPVLEREIDVAPLRRPFVELVRDAADPHAPITAATTIELIGTELLGEGTRLRLAGSDRPVTGGSSVRITFDLSTIPIADVRAGNATVQVLHDVLLGNPPAAHRGAESNVASFLLHPIITAASVGAGPVVSVTTDVTIGSRQRVQLAFLDPATGARRRVVAAPPRTADGQDIELAPGAGISGTHAIQLLVDGAGSRLVRNAGGTITDPVVVLS
jgi:hypothetical protein